MRWNTADHGGFRVDRVNRPLKAIQDQRFQNSITDARWIPRSSNHCNRLGLKEGPQRGCCRYAIAHLQTGHTRLARHDGKVHVDFMTFELFLDGKAGFLENVAHRLIGSVRDGPEMGEAIVHSQQGQSLQQQSSQSLTVQGVINGKGHLSRLILFCQVRTGRHDAGFALLAARDHQRQRRFWIGIVAQGSQQFGMWACCGEET